VELSTAENASDEYGSAAAAAAGPADRGSIVETGAALGACSDRTVAAMAAIALYTKPNSWSLLAGIG
jgi:hypothetical protein